MVLSRDQEKAIFAGAGKSGKGIRKKQVISNHKKMRLKVDVVKNKRDLRTEYKNEVLQSKDGRRIILKIKSSGDFDYFDIGFPNSTIEEIVSLNLEPRGDESFIIKKLKEMLEQTVIEDGDDLYLLGKHFDDLIGKWYRNIMDVFRSDKEKELSVEDVIRKTNMDKEDVEGMLNILDRRGWIMRKGKDWKYNFSRKDGA